MDKKIKKPWPTKKAMEQVYELNLWGSNNTEFYSGSGSHQPEIITPYIDVVCAFLKTFKTPITVCDLGCGDFNIGNQLVPFTKNYIAVDIVSNLIKHNTKTFQTTNLEFRCLDIAVDNLPAADCVILRQVLQHLSNKEVKNVVQKLINYKYIILTEHLPFGNFMPNKDIISGQGIRIKKQSGIDLLAAPFHLKVKEEKQLFSYTLKDGKGIIVTTLYRLL
ncbi:class I SAM-dependent methyltransferase [Polaribacter sp. L3A8]|uniref:class I SAM-dependent methyltransferase n=1 Tax=Polaribacter sp. L3A8 TaxID=2686361 RepID=UPI00131B5119|nr:class I SAM-dependent methyltransferase [Polaribacter sp. L3A8]